MKALPKMYGSMRYYFPDFPDHELNGMMAWGAGKFEGEYNGKMTRKVVYGMDTRGYEFFVKPEMFGVERVLVKHWYPGPATEFFYLIA